MWWSEDCWYHCHVYCRGYVSDGQETYHIDPVNGTLHRVFRNRDRKKSPFKCGKIQQHLPVSNSLFDASPVSVYLIALYMVHTNTWMRLNVFFPVIVFLFSERTPEYATIAWIDYTIHVYINIISSSNSIIVIIIIIMCASSCGVCCVVWLFQSQHCIHNSAFTEQLCCIRLSHAQTQALVSV